MCLRQTKPCLDVAGIYQRRGLEPGPIDGDNLDRMRHYAWPGNVRELRNVIERAIITSPDGQLRLDRVLPAVAPPAAPAPAGLGTWSPRGEILTDRRLRQLERDNMIAALERAGWRVGGAAGAAALLDVSPSTLKSRMKALEVRKPGGG